jgi:hypothetical protein
MCIRVEAKTTQLTAMEQHKGRPMEQHKGKHKGAAHSKTFQLAFIWNN